MSLKLKTVLIIAITAITIATNNKQENTKKMITVKVTYGVKKEFVSKNKENIYLFMKDFKALKNNDFTYSVYTLDDGTFVHISSYANEHVQQQILNTPSFKEFQRQRDGSGLTKAHNIEVLNLVASTLQE